MPGPGIKVGVGRQRAAGLVSPLSGAARTILGDVPLLSAVTAGPTWMQNWYSQWISIENTQYAGDVATDTGNVGNDWLPVGIYDRSSTYLALFQATGNTLYRDRAIACAAKYQTYLVTGASLFNTYTHGGASCFAHNAQPAGFGADMRTNIITHLASGYYWDVLNNNAASADPARSDARSTARLLQGVLYCRHLGLAFPTSGLHPPVQALGSWDAVAESIVNTILATENGAGAWHFNYTGASGPYVKSFMNVLLCHALYDYMRIIDPSAARKTAIIDAMQRCANWLYANAWVSGSAAVANQECWAYCWPAVTGGPAGDVPFPSGDDNADLAVEIAWLYGYLQFVGRTRAGSTPGTNDYPDIVKRAFIAANTRAALSLDKQRNEFMYRGFQTCQHMIATGAAAITPPPPVVGVTLNPADKSANITLTNNNLTAAPFAGYSEGARATEPLPASSKRIWLVRTDVVNNVASGVCAAGQALSGGAPSNLGTYWILPNSGAVYGAGAYVSDAPASPAAGAHIAWAVDLTLNKMWVGSTPVGSTTITWQGGSNPETNTGGFTIANGPFFPFVFFSREGAPQATLMPDIDVPAGLAAAGFRNLNGGILSSALPALPAGAKVAFVGHSFIGRSGNGNISDLTNVNPRRDFGQGNVRGALAWMHVLDTDRRFNVNNWHDAGKSAGSNTDHYVDGSYQGVSSGHLITTGGLPGALDRLPYVLSLNPDIVLLDIGINDANSSVSDSATLISRLDAAISQITNAGKRCLAITLTDRWPSGGGSWPNGDARIGYIDAANTWLVAQEGRAGGRVRICDLRNLGFNRTGTLGWNAAYFSAADGVHPNPTGGKLVADTLLPILRSMVTAGAGFDGDAATGNLWPDAGLLGTTGTRSAQASMTVATGTVATGWNAHTQSGTSGIVCSKEVIDGSFEKQVFTITPVNDANVTHQIYLRDLTNPTLASMGLAAGDWFEMWVHVELSANAGWKAANLVGEVYNGGTGVLFANAGINNPDASTTGLPLSGGFSGWLRMTPQQVPLWSAVDNLRLTSRPLQLAWDRAATGTLVAKVSRPIIRKVSDPRTAWNWDNRGYQPILSSRDWPINGVTFRTQNAELGHCAGVRGNRFRSEVRQGDTWSGDIAANPPRNRSEFAQQNPTLPVTGTDFWSSLAFKIATDAPSEAVWMTLMQIHSSIDSVPAMIAPYLYGSNLTIETASATSTDGSGAVAVQRHTVANLQRLQWHNLVMRVRGGVGGAGQLQAWLNGTELFNLTSIDLGYPNIVGYQPYMKFGLYRRATTLAAAPVTQTFAAEYANIEIGTASLLARVSSPLPI
jgi:lysophospholipase L1-like esterase